MKEQVMKMKYITPSITVMEAILEPYLLEGSTGKGGSASHGNDPEYNINETDEEIDQGAKGYNAWEAWDEF